MTLYTPAPTPAPLPIKIRVAYFRRLKSGSLRTIVYWRTVKADSKRLQGRKLVKHSVLIAGSFQTFLTLPECVPALASAVKNQFQAKAASGEGGSTWRVAGVFTPGRFGTGF